MYINRQSYLIAIADDDPAILESISMLLELEGYQVESILNGKGILQKEVLPDLYILDVWMSGTDGRDLCKSLKANPLTRNIPVLLISASNELKLSIENCGADKFLAKPFEMNSLLEAVDSMIGINLEKH
ncbi:MAG: response regulator [Pedobacter sp.]|nr:MAG: response regulator [Pedobacter sp.]